jgi:NADPH-dependent ferric siderophore reductase
MPRVARPTTIYPMSVRRLQVARVADVTPGMRRVTLTGDQLGAVHLAEGHDQPALASPGFDDDVRLVYPYPGETEPVLPLIRDGGLKFPKDRKPLGRAYTIRAYDPVTRELDVDFVKHGLGVATTWAYRARPGDEVHMIGPSSSKGLPEDVDWLLVVGDDTALPAIARLVEELAGTVRSGGSVPRAQVFIEIARTEHRQDLPEVPGVEVTWLVRDGADPGSTTFMLDAIRSAQWWNGEAFAWLAGEQSAVRDMRRFLVEERGMDKAMVDFTGYWRLQPVEALEDDAAVPDSARHVEAFQRFHELGELLPPLAMRAAANLGVGELISRGVTHPADLATRTGADAGALGRFLRYLEAIELLESEDGAYRLTDTGQFLAQDNVLDVLRRDGVTARRELAFHGIEEAVRTGHASYRSVTGIDAEELHEDPAFEHKLLEDTAGPARFLVGPLAGASAVRDALGGDSRDGTTAPTIAVHSPGATTIAGALTAAFPAAQVVLPALPTAAAWMREDLPGSLPDPARRAQVTILEQSIFETTGPVDAVLFLRVLRQYPDAELELILRRATESLRPDGRVLVLEDVMHTDEIDEHEAEADLLQLAMHGSKLRTAEEYQQVFTAAGLATESTEIVGWGNTLRVLAPR